MIYLCSLSVECSVGAIPSRHGHLNVLKQFGYRPVTQLVKHLAGGFWCDLMWLIGLRVEEGYGHDTQAFCRCAVMNTVNWKTCVAKLNASVEKKS